ncbi:MAG: hypothetical protein CMB32_01455 [Euryarchaeota archaeon]|nr:hypothetical protein [Euryarchaeota archaeon]
MTGKKYTTTIAIVLISGTYAIAQSIGGRVVSDSNSTLSGAVVYFTKDVASAVTTSEEGEFELEYNGGYPVGLSVKFLGYESLNIQIDARSTNLELILKKLSVDLDDARVESSTDSQVEWMKAIDKGGVYSGVKSSVIRVDKDIVIPGEVQARSIFSKIPGVNMWESDAAGLQIGIGVRGLSPNRSSHLSVRQNGSPISADPLGYPESYYSPPIEAVSKIEYISGASALQYGSQLGGMLNFEIKQGEIGAKSSSRLITSGTAYTPLSGQTRSNYNVFGEHKGGRERSSHYVCFDIKEGEGWRENTEFDSKTVIVTSTQDVNSSRGKLTFKEDYTLMRRLERQPGGLTDVMFESNPRASIRDRNWFKVDWRILRGGLEYAPFTNKWRYNFNAFKLDANRQALGFLGLPTRVDTGEERDLIYANFYTGGFDARATRIWNAEDGKSFNALVLGVQGYRGITHMMQGDADTTSLANFEYTNPNNLEGSDYSMPNSQLAAFAQGIINLNNKLAITPGMRVEHIDTRADGWYRQMVEDFAGQIIADSVYHTSDTRARQVVLPGVGFSFKSVSKGEFYGNAVRNYRAINFSDIQIQNLGIKVDPDISDESGANFDFGFRKNAEKISWDVSAFALYYSNKIGVYPHVEPDPIIGERVVFLRTNISDARTYGLEGLVSFDLYKNANSSLEALVSASYMKGRYIGGEQSIFHGKEIEFIPEGTFRSVLTWSKSKVKSSIQWNWVASQFTDADNSLNDPNGIYGEMPAYSVLDLSFSYSFSNDLSLGFKINNALNENYFTRRATGYPGPGIIPSDGINMRLSLVYKNL